ncbi:MAG: LysM peptidoglycan-binding domain-containing protein [Deltaproteobacteria bacterium]|nr:LysM peptidoglycan-binding domain-containing protein [Deltaproteobacteria bacterium]
MSLRLNDILLKVFSSNALLLIFTLAILSYLSIASNNSYGAAAKIQAAASPIIQINFDNVSKITSAKHSKSKHKKNSILLTVTPDKLKIAYNNIKKSAKIKANNIHKIHKMYKMHKKIHKKINYRKINAHKIKNTVLNNSGLLSNNNKISTNTSRIFPMIINKEIIHYIHFYQNTGRNVFKTMLERSERYIPMIKSVFKKLGLPNDLAYLAMVESGFSPTAYSYAGASGMWQFIPSTARIFGLTINWWVDERRNPIESTYAAGKYLKNLFNTFGSWYLAAAAYNSGQMTIERALSLYPGGNFWTISQNKPYLLPGQTRRYVPKIIAAAIIAKDPQNFGFKNLKYRKPIKFAQVKVPFSVSLYALAKCAEIPENNLWKLNPDILRGSTPPNDPNFLLNIPADKLKVFVNNFKDIKQYIPKTPKIISVSYNKPQGQGWYYTVQPGNTLDSIALKYGVPLNTLEEANHLSSYSLINVGEKLLIPGNSNNNYSSNHSSFYYTVQPGNTLDSIALKYGVPLNTLEEANHLSSYSLINVGEKLLIPGNSNNNFVKPVNLQKKYITVKPGMTLWSIANTYNISLQTIKNINNINNSSNIRVGEKIYLTGNYSNSSSTSASNNKNIDKTLIEYKVKFGDSLYAIAAKYHSSVKSIMAYNNLKNQNSIYPGQVLKIN